MRVSASMWKAWLSCRLPPRSRRWRSVRPEETGIGAHPERRASCASVWKRWMPPIARVSSRTRRIMSGTIRTRTWAGVGVLQAAGDLDLPGGLDEHTLSDRPVGPQVMQLPAR
jgi:hypothetical protein